MVGTILGMLIIAGFISPIVIGIVIGIRAAFPSSIKHCSKCKQKNVMKACKREAIKRSKRSQDLGNGKRRYYTLVTYRITYKCENCGATCVCTKEVEED